MNPPSDYLTLLFSFPKFPPASILCFFFLALFRLIPLVIFAPFLGSKLPSVVKMGIAISFAVILLPHLLQTSHNAVYFNNAFIGYALKELLIGFIISLFASVPFYIAQSAGTLIDFIRGSSSLQVTDPFMQSQVSPLGLLYNYTLIALFYQIDGPFILFDGLITSYQIIPADGLINPLFFNLKLPLWQTIMQILHKILEVSIQIAAPSVLAVLMTELFLGIANRLAPQVQISFLGMALKSLAGLIFLALAWSLIVNQMGKQVLDWLREVFHVLQQVAPFAT